MAALDSQTAVVCYQAASPYESTCRRLFRGGSGVSEPVGSLVVYPGTSYGHSVARLGRYAALVCYDTSSTGMQCSTIARPIPAPPSPPPSPPRTSVVYSPTNSSVS